MNDTKVLGFSSAGVLDLSFGNQGQSYLSCLNVSDAIFDTLDSFIILGTAQTLVPDETAFAYSRMFLDGTKDTNWGFIIQDDQDIVSTAMVEDNGTIVSVGKYTDGIYLERRLLDGTLDTTFGTGGIVNTHALDIGLAGHAVYPSDIAIQENNQNNPPKIIVSGFAIFGIDSKMVLLRYHNDGTLDTNFGSSGTGAVTNPSLWGETMALNKRGKIIVSGNGGQFLYVARYMRGGNIDNNFGTNGLTSISVNPSAHSRDIVFSKNGRRFYLVGSAASDAFIAAIKN